jgi:hypothetical protein
MDTMVKKYVTSHLKLIIEGHENKISYVGWENEGEAIYCYFEIQNVSQPRKLKIDNSLLYDEFTDQANIMHVKVNGKRQTQKVNYPDKTLEFTF